MSLKLVIVSTFLCYCQLGVSCAGNLTEISYNANSKKPYLVSSTNTSWFDAYIICQEYNMELATVESQHEEYQLDQILKSERTPRDGIGNGYWISGARKGFSSDSEKFIWFVNGKSLLYSNFLAGQPDNAGENEACIEIFLSGDSYWWNDYTCEQKIGFICQNRDC